MKRRSVIILAVVAVAFLAGFLLLKQRNSRENNLLDKPFFSGVNQKTEKERIIFQVASRETKLPSSIKESPIKKEEEDDDDELKYWVSSDDEIKEAALGVVKKLYESFDDMDFSGAVPAEMVFVQNTEPGSQSPGHYVVVLRNSSDEIMARAVLTLLEEKGGKKLLEAGNVEPFPPAFSDPETQEEYRKAERYPLTDSFPRISEEKAKEIARERLGDGYFARGLTNLFLFLPSLEYYFQIGVPFNPYYEFTIEGDEEKTIWINSETGVVIDYKHLDADVQKFEDMMKEERKKPLPPMEEPDRTNDD